eukprot:gene10621-14263_t
MESTKVVASTVVETAGNTADGEEKIKIFKRYRNKAQSVASGETNRWDVYRGIVHKNAAIISRTLHVMEVYRQSYTSIPFSERVKQEEKIRSAKQTIYFTLQQIAAENHSDKVWMELADTDGSGGMVDVEQILCSKCNLSDEEGNDILFCDRTGCYRAYHQNCLEPPLLVDSQALMDPNSSWFCWQCECIDDCLDIINELCESNYTDWRLVFPELRAEAGGSDTLLDIVLDDDDEDEDDEEYNLESDYERSIDEDSVANEDEDEDAKNADGTDQEKQIPIPVISSRLDEQFKKEADSDDDSDVSEEDEDFVVEDDSSEEDESEIDETELSDILADAGVNQDAVLLSTTRSLRPKKATPNDDFAGINGDGNDIGVKVGRVHRGIIVIGTVTEVFQIKDNEGESSATAATATIDKYNNIRWKTSYENKTEFEYDWSEICEAVRTYREYEKHMVQTMQRNLSEQSDLQDEVKKLADVKEYILEENILQQKRARQEIDYEKLNMELFGDQDDEEDDNDDDDSYESYDSREPKRRKYTAKGGRPSLTGQTNRAPPPAKPINTMKYSAPMAPGGGYLSSAALYGNNMSQPIPMAMPNQNIAGHVLVSSSSQPPSSSPTTTPSATTPTPTASTSTASSATNTSTTRERNGPLRIKSNPRFDRIQSNV